MATVATITMSLANLRILSCMLWGLCTYGIRASDTRRTDSVQYHTHDAERNTKWSRLSWQACCMNSIVVRGIWECAH